MWGDVWIRSAGCLCPGHMFGVCGADAFRSVRLWMPQGIRFCSVEENDPDNVNLGVADVIFLLGLGALVFSILWVANHAFN